MSQESTEEQGFLKRRVPLKWVLVGLIAMLVVMVAIVATLLLVDRSRDEARRAAAAATTTSTLIASPYDFSELPGKTDLSVVVNAAFLSIFLPNDDGKLTSYGISSGLTAAQELSAAIRDAEEVDPGDEASTTVTTGQPAAADAVTTSTITFVFADRGTLTFVLDLDRGLIARGEQAWRPAEELRALVEAAILGNK